LGFQASDRDPGRIADEDLEIKALEMGHLMILHLALDGRNNMLPSAAQKAL
jgi:hypothetical protein